MKKLELLIDFLEGLSIDIDWTYHLDEVPEDFDELRDLLEEAGAFDKEVTYYSRAMEYLTEYDTSLNESLRIAADMGFSLENLNSETLASLLVSQKTREDFEELETEISEFLEELENMESGFLIMDHTNNTCHEFIDSDGKNCALKENAEIFETEEEAKSKIYNRGWREWARIVKADQV